MTTGAGSDGNRWYGLPVRHLRSPLSESSIPIQILVGVGGMAALSWEVLWQLRSTLALGVSAAGTSLTLASTMAGMTAGSLAMGTWLRHRRIERPIRLYGLLEAVIGLSGLLMLAGFAAVEAADSRMFAIAPSASSAFHVGGIVLVLGVPTFCMGATVPVFQLLARGQGTLVSRLYGLNTLGAAAGVLVITFGLLPWLGVWRSCAVVAGLNLTVFALTRIRALESPSVPEEVPAPERDSQSGTLSLVSPGLSVALPLVFVTGYATFGLEVAWFRSMRAAFHSTTDGFAIMLVSVLIPLATGARLVPWMARRNVSPYDILIGAGVAILLATPLVERMDQMVLASDAYWSTAGFMLVISLGVLGIPMLLLGMALPWFLEAHPDPRETGMLYAINAFGAVVGSVSAAWLLLPSIGFARTAWSIGGAVVALAVLAGGQRRVGVIAGAAALGIAVVSTSTAGRDRIPGMPGSGKIVAVEEAADSTVSVVDVNGMNVLLIDGFWASSEQMTANYMQWMGRLPMMLHEDPKKALVICFGTGQTANAVREEGPRSVDLVDVSEEVFSMATHFPTNRGVMEDGRVTPIVMDGRAWLRRTDVSYDVVTLEPMPPNFAGVNSLYSLEFYELIAQRLSPGGIVAQWVPWHILEPDHSRSITATFLSVFPDSLLWIDPVGGTGILVGRLGSEQPPLGESWPGLEPDLDARTLSADVVQKAVALDGRSLAAFADGAELITDDNQLLSYGASQRSSRLVMLNLSRGTRDGSVELTLQNLRLVRNYSGEPVQYLGPKAMRRPTASTPWTAQGVRRSR